MKSFSLIILAAALLSSSLLQAAAYQPNQNVNTTYADHAGVAGPTPMAWGVTLIGLAVIGTVTGLVAANATSKPATYSH